MVNKISEPLILIVDTQDKGGGGYSEYLKTWLQGLKSEISFWKNQMAVERSMRLLDDNYNFESNIIKTEEFIFDELIPEDCHGKDYKFVDIGSGPYSVKHNTDKVNFIFKAIDPLAHAYNKLKDKYEMNNGNHIQTGHVELLHSMFPQNTFDMVHMSNSLDHSFDALYGLYNLIFICKIGGKVILRHAENEAEKRKHRGLHQWNLSVNNQENSFVIWRGDQRFDVCKILKEYVDFEIFPYDITNVENKNVMKSLMSVVCTKKKNIDLPETNYGNLIFQHTYEYLIDLLLEELQNYEGYGVNLLKSVENPSVLKEILNKKGISNIAIYGMGRNGKAIFNLLKMSEINITDIIDRDRINYRGMTTCSINDYIWDEKSYVIVTPDNSKIREEMFKAMQDIVPSKEHVLTLPSLFVKKNI